MAHPARCREPRLLPAAMGIESRQEVAGDDQYLRVLGPQGAQISNAWFLLQMCSRNKTSTAPRNCYAGTERGQILMLTGTLDLLPKTQEPAAGRNKF